MKHSTHVSMLFAAIGIVLTGFMQGVTLQAQNSPVSAARFGISIDGVEIGVFEQLISEADLGTGAGGQAMTLTGGRTRGMEMAAWHELVILGDVAAARKSATIVIYNASGSPVKTYHLENAWPSKVSLDTSDRGRLRTATVMLMYESIRVQTEQ
jgi:T4-like virus tail tube protein gp19